MSNNLLTGTIPSSFAKLPVLQVLTLSLNLLHGGIVVMGEASGSPSLLQLDLSYNKLDGPLPAGLVSMVVSSTDLGLSHNNFSGPLPRWLGQLVVAQVLDFSSNNFDGTIPDEQLRQCAGLTLLNLSFNHLSGEIFGGSSKLDYLQTLDISSNNLTGALPPFLKSLHRLTFLNVSFNNFRGPIPVSGVFQHLNSSSFQGNPGLCGSIIHKQRRPPASHPHVRRKPFFILGATLAATAVLLGCVAVLAACFHYRTRAAFQGENFLAAETRRFTAEELALATQGYAGTNLLGQGTHAAVYKAVLSDGMIVAVKKLKELCAQEVLLKEAHILSKLRHRNLVRVRGCVLNLDVSALVLDYMPEGSLEHYLHDRREHEEYDWRRLTTIATGLANALIYLHHEYGMPIIHGDIKPSNILLDSNLEAHLADFGLSKLGKDGVFSIVSNFKGTIGYMAPEYAYAAEATTKVDVYSFGVVILEMLTGQKPTEVSGGVSLHEWVLDKLSEGSGSSVLQELLDARLVQSVQSPTKVGQALQLFKMGIACTQNQPRDRPTIQGILPFLCTLQLDTSSSETV
ncbi:hypothetical protein L7F22_054606 [Adiantum nelumboides]|nr:hypothetical protein [Adiantum nelumboides]